MANKNSRAIAAIVLSNVLSDQGSLSTELENEKLHKEFPLIQEICFGVCRHYFPLRAILSTLLDKPLRTKDLDVDCLLMVGVYQLIYLRVPDHAAVNETVSAAKILKKPWAKGLVNAVLRKCVSHPELLEKTSQSSNEEVLFSHPAWLIEQVKLDWPDLWQQILNNSNYRAPMTLRVNLSKISRDGYMEILRVAGKSGSLGQLADSALYLSKPCQVQELPGFAQGEVSVQDEASQLVPPLLDLAPGHSILDACAAPGGKTTHLLESERSHINLLALDSSPRRLVILKENLNRLKLQTNVKTADAARPKDWWDGVPFDRILLDAPCSATGIIRRHPDIKLLRRQGDIKNYSDRQLVLLVALWGCLKSDGLLLYTTCSILRQENDGTIKRFLNQQQDAKYQAITADWGVECSFGRQLLPQNEGSDGFYFALLRKS